MSDRKKAVYLTRDQIEYMQKLLEYNWQQEVEYQLHGDRNTEWLEFVLPIIDAFEGKPRNFFEEFVKEDVMQSKYDDIAKIKGAQ